VCFRWQEEVCILSDPGFPTLRWTFAISTFLERTHLNFDSQCKPLPLRSAAKPAITPPGPLCVFFYTPTVQMSFRFLLSRSSLLGPLPSFLFSVKDLTVISANPLLLRGFFLLCQVMSFFLSAVAFSPFFPLPPSRKSFSRRGEGWDSFFSSSVGGV